MMKKENKMFAGSTSSVTGMLSQIYFLISGDKQVDTRTLSWSFTNEVSNRWCCNRKPS